MKKVLWLTVFLSAAVYCSARNIVQDPGFDNGMASWTNWGNGAWAVPGETGEGTVAFGWVDGASIGQNTGHIIQPGTVYTMTATIKTIDQAGGQAEGVILTFQSVEDGYATFYTERFWFPDEYNFGAGTNTQSPWMEYTISFNSSDYPEVIGDTLVAAVGVGDDGRWDAYGNLFIDSLYVNIPGADNPNPADGSTVPLSLAMLEWTKPDPNTPGATVTSSVYWGTEPNMAAPHYGLAPIAEAQGIVDTFTPVPVPMLDPDQLYYWTVECDDPSRSPSLMAGSLWSFNTVASKQVAHWTMDSKDGGVYVDSVGGHNATIVGDPNIVPGVVDNAAQISVDKGVGNAGTWDPSYLSNRLTVTCWVKWDGSTGNQVIVSKANDWQNPGVKWLIGVTSGGGVFVLGGTSEVGLGADAITKDEWTMIAFTYDGVNGTIYALSDGMARDTGGFTMGANNEATVWIGSRGSDATTPVEQFTGLIDDVQMFNYAIDAHGIVDMYNAVADPDQSFCVDDYDNQFDFNGNCVVDLADFAEFAGSWLDQGLYPSSL